MRAAIFLNGAPDSERLIQAVAEHADFVVAADGGAGYALAAGIVPDLIVGDMDSLGEDLAQEIERRGAELERHPVRKDKMDGHLAVLAAKERGATAADFLCAAGGKVGAVFALPHILLAAERLGLRSSAVADWGRMFVVETGSRTVEGAVGDSVSVFPLAGPATGVTLEGMALPADKRDPGTRRHPGIPQRAGRRGSKGERRWRRAPRSAGAGPVRGYTDSRQGKH